jgi:uncharacterized membrane protein YbhN (UPF0104 family)
MLGAWIVLSLDAGTWSAIQGVSSATLAAAVILFASCQVFGGLRLAVLLPDLALWREAQAATWAGYFWANFLPGTIGGDIVRGYRLKTAGVDLPTLAGALVLDRLTNFSALVVIAAVCAWPIVIALLGGIATIAVPVAALTLLAASASVLVRRSARVRNVTVLALQPLRRVMQSPARMIGIGVFTCLNLGAAIVAQWLIVRQLGIAIGVVELAGIICLVTVIVVIPVSLNGLGLQEVSFVAFLTAAGVPLSLALSFSLLARVLIVGASVIAGLVVLVGRIQAARHQRLT